MDITWLIQLFTIIQTQPCVTGSSVIGCRSTTLMICFCLVPTICIHKAFMLLILHQGISRQIETRNIFLNQKIAPGYYNEFQLGAPAQRLRLLALLVRLSMAAERYSPGKLFTSTVASPSTSNDFQNFRSLEKSEPNYG